MNRRRFLTSAGALAVAPTVGLSGPRRMASIPPFRLPFSSSRRLDSNFAQHFRASAPLEVAANRPWWAHVTFRFHREPQPVEHDKFVLNLQWRDGIRDFAGFAWYTKFQRFGCFVHDGERAHILFHHHPLLVNFVHHAYFGWTDGMLWLSVNDNSLVLVPCGHQGTLDVEPTLIGARGNDPVDDLADMDIQRVILGRDTAPLSQQAASILSAPPSGYTGGGGHVEDLPAEEQAKITDHWVFDAAGDIAPLIGEVVWLQVNEPGTAAALI